jgi:hypothetical protein
METFIHNVGDLSDAGRSAAETLVGHALDEHQQLVIQVVNLEPRRNDNESAAKPDELPDWCDVYAGLSDEQVATLEQAVSRRLDLKRART